MTEKGSGEGGEGGEVEVGWVYFVQVGVDGPIRISWASDPRRRIALGSDWHWRPLVLLGTVCAGAGLAEELQRELAAYRLGSRSSRSGGSEGGGWEWFEPDLEVLRTITRVTADQVTAL